MNALTDVAKRGRPLFRRTGFDLVRFPGIRHTYLRGQTMRRLGVDLVLDVGANVGQFAEDVRAYGYAGRIVSYEPMREAFAELERRASGDPLWKPVRAAVGADKGELEIHIAGNSVSSSLLPMAERHAEAAPKSIYVGTEVVPVERLDVLAHDDVAAARAPFLKVDTQGYESVVLDGASGLLDRMAAIELEMSLVTLYEGQALLHEIVARMAGRGFRLATVSPGLVARDTGETLQVDGIFVQAGV